MAEEIIKDQTEGADGGAGNEGAEVEKTYTQAELDALLKDVPGEDELKAFKDWKKGQQTEAEKAAEREAEYAAASSELAQLKAEKKIVSAGAKSEFSEFVASKVLAMGEDFDKNLEAYKKDHPQYFGETVIKKASTGAPMGGGTPQSRTTNDMMNEAIRSARK